MKGTIATGERLSPWGDQGGERLKALLIEDSLEDADLVRLMLDRSEADDIDLVRVSRLSEGLERLDRGDITLVLLDLSLPDSQGLETFSRVQEHAPDLPIVVLTGLNDEEVALRAVREGLQDYLVKGQIDSRLLTRTIRHAIERQRLTDKLHLERLVQKDPLTELLNRRGFQEALSREIRLNQRENFRSVAILLDLDDFKQINDTLGHSAGDVVLKETAGVLKERLRTTDYLARIGGDEFLVLLHNSSLDEGLQVAEKLRLSLGRVRVQVSSNREVTVTASAGVAELTETTPAVDQLLSVLHLALKRGKTGGKNRVATHREKDEFLDHQNEAVDQLRKCRGLYAVKLPIYDLTTGTEVGGELLSRFEITPFESPDDFFRLAFESGILTLVDHRCLRACIAAADPAPLHNHVNLFPSTLLDVPIEHLIEDFPEEARPRFTIEISEQQIIGDPRYLLKPIHALAAAGFTIAIDDVGFGHSNLESLVLLEPGVVKIDKRCVRDLAVDPRLQRFTERLVRVCQALGAEIIAEGIESREAIKGLLELGVTQGQGFFWGPPQATVTAPELGSSSPDPAGSSHPSARR